MSPTLQGVKQLSQIMHIGTAAAYLHMFISRDVYITEHSEIILISQMYGVTNLDATPCKKRTTTMDHTARI